jgi:hydrogenase nickel incorporation protein HypA/HybF
MHELAVTESILEIALRHARSAEARQVTALHLVIGELASIIDDSVQFYWDIIAKDTIAEGAQLFFRRVPIEMQCQSCQSRFLPNENDFTCPECCGTRVKILSGEEFFLESIDIQTD